jgi:hypothetical protein
LTTIAALLLRHCPVIRRTGRKLHGSFLHGKVFLREVLHAEGPATVIVFSFISPSREKGILYPGKSPARKKTIIAFGLIVIVRR